jgi:hypothetical protein
LKRENKHTNSKDPLPTTETCAKRLVKIIFLLKKKLKLKLKTTTSLLKNKNIQISLGPYGYPVLLCVRKKDEGIYLHHNKKTPSGKSNNLHLFHGPFSPPSPPISTRHIFTPVPMDAKKIKERREIKVCLARRCATHDRHCGTTRAHASCLTSSRAGSSMINDQ